MRANIVRTRTRAHARVLAHARITRQAQIPKTNLPHANRESKKCIRVQTRCIRLA